MTTVPVQLDEVNSRFFVSIGANTSYLDFRKAGEHALEYYHTYTPPDMRGQGLAGEITRHALLYARKHNYKVIPSCSYVRSFIDKHPEFNDLI